MAKHSKLEALSLSNSPWRRLPDFIALTRLDRPIGIYLLLWPTLWAVWIASEGLPSLKLMLVFIGGVILMRSAGCVINDFADLTGMRTPVRQGLRKWLDTFHVEPLDTRILEPFAPKITHGPGRYYLIAEIASAAGE